MKLSPHKLTSLRPSPSSPRLRFPQSIAPIVLMLGALLPLPARAEAGAPQAVQAPARIVVSGTVPDEATRLKVLKSVRRIYGDHMVVDQISVGRVQAPPDWANSVEALITSRLKSISKGMLAVEGTAVSVRGEVGDESTRQGIGSSLTGSLNPGYTFRNALRVSASSQAQLDRTLDGRVIEFENGSALLTASGMRILDEMADAMKKMAAVNIEVIGHTDSTGTPASNLALSRARADSVKTYLVKKGLATASIGTSGMGADHPVASNATEDGRRQNRRIEFRATQ